MHILTHRKRACGPVVLFSLVAQVLALQIYDDLEVMSRNMHHGWEVLDGGTPLNDYVVRKQAQALIICNTDGFLNMHYFYFALLTILVPGSFCFV